MKPCECGHTHTPDGCVGPPTASDRWAGVTPGDCDCEHGPKCPCVTCEMTYRYVSPLRQESE